MFQLVLIFMAAASVPWLIFLVKCVVYALKNGHNVLNIWNYTNAQASAMPMIYQTLLASQLAWWYGINEISQPDRLIASVLFSKVLLPNANPYSSSCPMYITDISKTESGARCKGFLLATPSNIKRTIGNPFRSAHAAVLVLLGETVGGIAHFCLLDGRRSVVQEIHITYGKKARGIIWAESEVLSQSMVPGLVPVKTRMYSPDGQDLATLVADWKLE